MAWRMSFDFWRPSSSSATLLAYSGVALDNVMEEDMGRSRASTRASRSTTTRCEARAGRRISCV